MEKLIEKFYLSLSLKDAEGMTSCYHQDVIFEDPAFGQLKGNQACDMWRMLCESQKGKDFEVHFSTIKIMGNKGSAHWEAKYIFSQSGRPVHNKIDAQFEFKDGLIIKHTDNFDLHSWAKQALGFKGWLLGGTSFFKKKMNTQTNRLLNNTHLTSK